MLKTQQKIALARLIQMGVLGVRRMFGRDTTTNVIRRGLHWVLDLREGIDFSIWLLGAFEPGTVHAYTRLIKPGNTVLDIGANIGAHSLPLAHLVGPDGTVICFEPTDYAFSKLKRNVAANPGLKARIKLCQVMLIDDDSAETPSGLYSSWPLADEDGLHPGHHGRLMPTGGAKAMTLDTALKDIAPSRIDFIKLDIDGFESKMLRGASGILKRWHPKIILELSPYVLEEQGSSVEELTSILVGHGYKYWSLDTSEQLPSDSTHLRQMIPYGASLNVLAMPNS